MINVSYETFSIYDTLIFKIILSYLFSFKVLKAGLKRPKNVQTQRLGTPSPLSLPLPLFSPFFFLVQKFSQPTTSNKSVTSPHSLLLKRNANFNEPASTLSFIFCFIYLAILSFLTALILS